LGDSILALPLLQAFHDWQPELKMDVLIESPYAPVFTDHPLVQETLVLKPKNRPGEPGWSRARAIAEIRRRRYSAVLNLHGGGTSMLLSMTSGAPIRIGQRSYRNSWAYNVRIPLSSAVWGRQKLHTVEHQLTLLRWLDIPFPEKPRVSLPLNPAAVERVADRMDRSGVSGGEYVLIHPTATLFTKQWDEKRFSALADHLTRDYGLPVIFSSASPEEGILKKIGVEAGENHIYWSDLGLEDLFALIHGCRIFVGNDSGPTHAAAAFEKPIVVIWGSSDFSAWHPWNTRYELVRSDLPCMPCPGYTCSAFDQPRCILEITVDRVLEACHRMMAAPG